MASTVGPPPPPSDHHNRLSIDSLPTVDLRLLSQSELTALSLCSSHSVDLRRCDDVVIPKIDRTVFNESAGSRKQTFSRLRLAPRNTTHHHNNHHNHVIDDLPRSFPPSISPLDSDNSRIIALFKALFNNEATPPLTTALATAMTADDEESLIPVNVEYSDAFFDDPDRKRMRRTEDVYVNVNVDVDVDVNVDVDFDVNVNDNVDAEAKEREKEEREKELMNRNGEVVDLRELAKKEDLYGEEIRRRTEGKESAEELLGFITDLEGQWGSRRKKRKIVDANLLGDFLPNGWKVLIAMKKKLGRAWVFCRRYISPNGRYFVSCKDVSSYLLLLTSPEDIKQQPSVESLEDAIADNKLISESVKDMGMEVVDPSFPVTTECNDDENVQKMLSTSQNIDHGNQLVVSNVPPGGQATSALKCHKCSTAFGEKDELLSHLLSCHKRKRRKAGAPIEDDIMMKDGKYECQFCNKVFPERSSYFGHVGIHVKNYVKSIGGSPGLTVVAKQKDSAFAVAEVPVTVSETVRDVVLNVNSVSSVPSTLASGALIFNSADGKPEAGCEAETPLENGEVGRNNVKVNMETVQTNKMPADDTYGKLDETPSTTENNAREVEGAVDVSAIQPDKCSISVEENNNENNDLCMGLGEISAIDHMNSEVIKASPDLVENDEVELVSDSKQADIGIDGNVTASILQSDREASESDLLFGNKETSSGDLNSEDKSVVNNTVKNGSFAEDLELGDHDDGLMDGSDSGHLDMGIDAEQLPGSLDVTSDVLHAEEEAYVIAAKRVEFMESQLAESKENSSCSPSGDQPTTETQDEDFIGIVSDAMVGTCSLEDDEARVDGDISIAQERPEACASLQSKDDGCGYENEVDTVGHMELIEPGETGSFQVEQTCSFVNSPRELSNRESEEPKSDRVINPNLFFAPECNGRHLTADVITSNDQSHGDVSKLLGAFGNFVEDKQEEVSKSFLSGLTLNQRMHDVGLNNMTDASAPTTPMQLPELDKVDRTRTNKLIFDFGSINDVNSRFLGSVQDETAPEGTSPFSLWGQQTCIIEDDQNRIFDSARGAAQQERSSDRNSLNLIGLQQPSVVEYNLNKVCVNEQRYGVQHETEVCRKNNDIGREGNYGSARGLVQQGRASDTNSLLVGLQQRPDAGFNLNKVHMNDKSYGVQRSNESSVYSKNNEARTERISHGNTLNLAVFQQQCDTGYNLNKSCINQQSYGVQCNEAGAYSTPDESKQERITYGNSLSLASVPQAWEPRYNMNKACIPQTCDTGFGLNKGYMGTMQGLSKIDELGYSRDRDLMGGFGNSGGRPNQNVATDFLWRAAEGNILPGGLMDTSSSRGQSSGSYQAFDFLSDKGGNDMYAANEKFDNISSFEGLRSNNAEPMEFSFMTTQDSNSHLGHKNVLPFNTQINQGFGSSVWHQKPTLPNMMAGHVVSTLCVWCGNEFHQDSLGCEVQTGSIGYLCPTCKARMSGQFL